MNYLLFIDIKRRSELDVRVYLEGVRGGMRGGYYQNTRHTCMEF